MSNLKVGLRYIERWNTSLEKEVARYEAENAEKGQIVFYGPSYFTRWSERWGNIELSDAILGKSGAKCCVNRGFGSSCSEQQLYYYPRMVRALEPSALVYGVGWGNGLTFGYKPEELLFLAERVIAYAREDFPDMPIYIYGESRRRHPDNADKLACINGLCEIAKQYPNCIYLDCDEYPELAREDIYIEDNVHFNAEGFRIFGDFFREKLASELERF